MNCKMCTYIAVTNVVMHGYFFLVKIDILSLHVPMFMISKSTVPVPKLFFCYCTFHSCLQTMSPLRIINLEAYIFIVKP